MLVPAGSVRKRGDEDPLVQVRRGPRRGEGREEGEDAAAATELRRARGAGMEVGGQAGRGGGVQIVDEIRVDEAARGDVVDGMLGHTMYMTAGCGKVARAGVNGRG